MEAYTQAPRRGGHRPGHGTREVAPMQAGPYMLLLAGGHRGNSRTAFVKLDVADYAWAVQHRWTISAQRGTRYACRSHGPRGASRSIPLHRQLMGLERGDPRQVDHRNGDGLDNRRSNLRVVTLAQNLQNRVRPNKNATTSRYRGVSWRSRDSKWVADVKLNRVAVRLGYFDTEEAANAAAIAWRREQMPYSEADRQAAA